MMSKTYLQPLLMTPSSCYGPVDSSDDVSYKPNRTGEITMYT